MAAISSQGSWKQIAMQKAERLTDLWDVTKAWAGRAAEIVLSLCMFAQLIGVLPGVHYWPWVDNFILAVQVIMLDMGAFALHTLAEQARESGKEEAANQADRLATFLIRLMITTIALIVIGQVSIIFQDYASTIQAIVRYAEVVLILVRVVSTVKYIHTIHSLRSTSEGTALNPTQVATLEARMQEQVARMTEAFQTPPTLDYEEIARQLLPLVAPMQQANSDVLQELRSEMVLLSEQVVNLQATKSEQESEQFEDTGVDTLHLPIVNIAEYRSVEESEQIVDRVPVHSLSPKVTQKLYTPVSTPVSTPNRRSTTQKASGTAQEKALRILKKYPDIGPSELAKKAQISRSYASQILKQQSS